VSEWPLVRLLTRAATPPKPEHLSAVGPAKVDASEIGPAANKFLNCFLLSETGMDMKIPRQENIRARFPPTAFCPSPSEIARSPDFFRKKIPAKNHGGFVDIKVDRKFSKPVFNLFDGA
jgi:hypothetical protein